MIPGEEAPPSPTEVTLRLWQNGFSINDGELRPYNDPVNNEFLNSIRRGEIPQELRQRNTEVINFIALIIVFQLIAYIPFQFFLCYFV